MDRVFGGGRAKAPVGVAVGVDRIHGVAIVGDRARVVSVEVPGGVVGADPGVLAAAFTTLRAGLEEAAGPRAVGGRVSIALLPPLAEARLVELPPLRPGEATMMVAREPRRYFIGAMADRVIAAADRPRGVGGPALAATSSAALVDAVREAAGAAGWRVGAVVAAQSAWAAGAREAGAASIRVSFEGTVYAIALGERGAPVSLRRYPVGDAMSGAGSESGPVVVLTDDAPMRPALAAGAGQQPAATSDPVAFAALHAASAEPALATPAATRARRAEGIRSVSRLSAAALLLVVAAGTIELWGARRELEAVSIQRRELGPSLPALLELSDSLAAVEARRVAIREIAATRAPVTPVLMDLASLLPADTYLASFRSRADTLTVEAAGGGAARALTALQGAASLSEVRLRGNVVREMREGSRPIERFTVDALIVPPAATEESGAKTGLPPEPERGAAPRPGGEVDP